MLQAVQTNLDFLLGKESPEKKTSKNFEMKVNSISKFDYKLFIILFFISLAPAFSVYADENLNYSVTVEPALNITTSANKVSLDLNPLNHDFDSQDLAVSVSTNNETGYKLYVNTDSTKLVEKDDSNLYIETLSNEVSENDFVANRWGYRIGSGNYLPFVSGTLLNSSKTQVENNSSTLTFAAKVGYETKAGTYNLALNFQATANPLAKTIADAEYMQDVSSKEIGGCPADLTTGQVYHLKDSRDETTYYVAKLADGNCWMLDNLALNIISLSVDDMKDKTNATETELKYLKGVLTGTTSDQYATSGVISSLTPSFSVPNINTSYIDVTDSVSNRWGNGQHKYGILYNFCAASAGTYCYGDNNMNTPGSPSGTATSDICPAGWQLPTINNYVDLCTITWGSTCSGSGAMDMAANNVNSIQNQLSVPLAGYYGNGGSGDRGVRGSVWANTYNDAKTMRRLFVTSSEVQFGRAPERYWGYAIRCILKSK